MGGTAVPLLALALAGKKPPQPNPSFPLVTSESPTFDKVVKNLNQNQKYQAVLDQLLNSAQKNKTKQITAINLIKEMNQKNIKLTSTSLKVLVDECASADTIPNLDLALRAAKVNGACPAFGSAQLSEGGTMRASRATPLPTETMQADLTSAVAFCASLGAIILSQIADVLDFALPGEVEPLPLPLIVAILAGIWGFDRYSRRSELSKSVGRGISRLFDRDLTRESTVESASFLIGYLLGLPTCAFQPTAVRPLDLLTTSSSRVEEDVDNVLPDPMSLPRIVDRLLVWQLAPFAAEASSYEQIIASRPGIALEMLRAARRRQSRLIVNVDEGGWGANGSEDVDDLDSARVSWAYGEARRLLQRYSGVHAQLQDRMESGVSVGGSVLLVEERLKGMWGSI